MKKYVFISIILLSFSYLCSAIEPDYTLMYAKKGDTELFLDIYKAAKGTHTTLQVPVSGQPEGVQKPKPTVLFIFGGGFITGARNEKWYDPWYQRLTQDGYNVVAIDYRLGLVGVKTKGKSLEFARAVQKAIDMAVEDLYSATLFLIENGEELGIDPRNIVISGSSAGAMTSLQAEYYISNRMPMASVLPSDFNYAGVMSFAGSIYSDNGMLKFNNKPCPILMLHGTADKIVTYDKIKVMKLCLGGSACIAEVLDKAGYPYSFYRFNGHTHEIAGNMMISYREEISFLERSVIAGSDYKIDAYVDDPSVPAPDNSSFADLYK